VIPSSLPGFRPVVVGSARLLVRDGHDAAVPLFLAAWAGEVAERVGGGRASHPVVALADGGRAVVRRFRRGGLVRHLNRDLYFGGDRAAEELRATEAARAGGVRAPEVLAAGRRRAGPGYRAMLATRMIEGATDSASWLARADAAARAAMLREASRQIGRMHAAGVAHPDLNLQNLLVRTADEVWIIDFDRARVFGGSVPAPRRRRDLDRLARSAAKLGLPLTPADYDALRAGYGDAWPA